MATNADLELDELPFLPARPTATGVLSPAQERLWLLEQLHPGTSHPALAIRFRGLLASAALRKSLMEVVRRHDALRTSVLCESGKPSALIAPDLPLNMPIEHLEGLPTDECQRQVHDIFEAEVRRPFALDQLPLFRVKCFRLAWDDQLLILVAHPLVADSCSLGVLYREIVEFYRTCIPGQTASLSPALMDYSEFAARQCEAWENGDFDEHMAYWREQLGGKLPGLDLPTDHPRPAVQTRDQATESFVPHPDLYPALQVLSQSRGIPLPTVLLTAFQVLLHRLARQEEIVIGLVTPGRVRPETGGMVGPLMNVLPMLTRITGEMSFVDIVAAMHRTETEARAHQELPFEALLDLLTPERDLSRSPLFQAAFLYDDRPLQPVNLPGLSIRPTTRVTGVPLCDLTLALSERADGLEGELIFNPAIFEPETILRLLGHFQTLLEGIASNPESPADRLPLLTKTERHRLLVDWNRTAADYPGSACIHQLFEQQVGRTPDAVALICEDRELRFRQLDERANRLADELHRLGVGPETRVAICMTRSLEMVVGLYAIHKAGGAYVPIDPAYPAERQAFMLEDSKATVLLAQTAVSQALPATAAKIVLVDAPNAPVASNNGTSGNGHRHAQSPHKNQSETVTPKNLAYVIYTSGSTGKPKGVMVRHRNVVNFFTGMDAAIGREPGVWLALTSISFDISVLELFWTLTRGFKVVLYPDEAGGPRHAAARSKSSEPGSAGSRTMADLIRRHGVTHLQCTPSRMSMMVQDARTMESLRRMEKIFLGGEPLPATLAQQLDGCGELFNLYGPTETTIWSTVHPVTRNSGTVSIGRPIANTRIYLLDSHLQPVPIGVPGELVIGGAGVARGYLDRPELTAERFVPDHFSNQPDARLYRTGDLARYNPGGTIQFLGRLDHQVKLRGFRIELGEIGATLRRHADIREAAVSVWEAGPNDKRLAAYFVPNPGAQPKSQELRRFLKTLLPDYMVPSTFVSLEALPLTLNGKINLKALPTPQPARATNEQTHQPILSELEQAIAEVWQEFLHFEQIGREDNFFELGGTDRLAVQAHARLCERLGIDSPLLQFFALPNLATLAKHLLEQHPDRCSSDTRRRAGRRHQAFVPPMAPTQDFSEPTHHEPASPVS